MTLQQLRYLCAIVDNGMSISRAAEHLYVSQPGISKIVKLLESELGLELFVRRGNRIVDLTSAGREVLAITRNILSYSRDLKNISKELSNRQTGILRVATTHLQARYALLSVIQKFTVFYPHVDLYLTQDSIDAIAELISSGEADLGLSGVPDTVPDNIVTLNAYSIERCVIVPANHPLLSRSKTTIRDLAEYPLIKYDDSTKVGMETLNEFNRHGLRPRVVLQATDANVIKAYVGAGLGIAVIQKMAIEPLVDRNIKILPYSHVFPSSMTYLMFRRGQHIRGYIYDLVRMICPRLTNMEIDKAIGK